MACNQNDVCKKQIISRLSSYLKKHYNRNNICKHFYTELSCSFRKKTYCCIFYWFLQNLEKSLVVIKSFAYFALSNDKTVTIIMLAHRLVPQCRYLTRSVSTFDLVCCWHCEDRCYDCHRLKVDVQNMQMKRQTSADGLWLIRHHQQSSDTQQPVDWLAVWLTGNAVWSFSTS